MKTPQFTCPSCGATFASDECNIRPELIGPPECGPYVECPKCTHEFAKPAVTTNKATARPLSLETLSADFNGCVWISTRFDARGPFKGFSLRISDPKSKLNDQQRIELLRLATADFFAQFPTAKFQRDDLDYDSFIIQTKGRGVIWFTVNNSQVFNEHAALVAVAEAAKPALEELEDLAEHGIERTFAEGSLADNGKVVVMLDAATLTVLRDALANLAAVRGQKG